MNFRVTPFLHSSSHGSETVQDSRSYTQSVSYKTPYNQYKNSANLYKVSAIPDKEPVKASVMHTEVLLIQPGELKFPFELRRQISCSVQLINITNSYVAFKVKTTSPKKYCVRPNTGTVSPGATCNVTVTMQAQKEFPPDMQCKDKFLVQSVIVSDEASRAGVSADAFNKEPGKDIFEKKLRVVYVSPPQPPSPVPESSEEGVSPRPSLTLDNGFDIGIDAGNLKTQLAEAQRVAAKLMDEKETALQRNKQLQDEVRTLNPSSGKDVMVRAKEPVGFSFLFVLIIGLLGILVGYFLHS
ncbi:hypothetical protein KP509_22G049200 [Ceratopteris richardii]|uniref:MSP domain-containing protein n=2 Tax=Ceratopteris richardii TaxID=49495 RepID=A0A8T2S7R6_CERRI|nr:hypothetical protein KP509_22G049200 [Ceratopteris richardii]KAH7307199.1 hypothetical protein KP509_22G049200 [Ceratopteris richardii]KAH7307200.1 hypothetical protein KP509_22G049200 [Ceratopteris richardii]